MSMKEGVLTDMIFDDRTDGIFRVDRRAFTRSDVLEAERRLIFDRSWLYIGHESEISLPGTFVTRKVGGRPIIMNRDADGQVRVFYNACPHRGNVLCREKSGAAGRFTCFYHGWTFSSKGKLIGVPHADSYTPAFKKDEMGLRAVPRTGVYRGLVFLSFDADIVDLETYLGNAR